MKRSTVIGALLLVSTSAMAGGNVGDAEIDARLKTLARELRCLVCQNQTLAESDADLARDLRREIREMMRAGRSDAEIVAFMVQRYGDFVLYRPPLKRSTWLLWFGPLLAGAAAVTFAVQGARKREPARDAPLSAAEEEKLFRLLLQESQANSIQREKPR